MNKSKRIHVSMPTTKSPARKTTARKTRARKSTSLNTPVVSKKTVVTEVKKEETQVAPVKPEAILSFEDYKKDFEARLKIHNYEVNELIKDCKWVYEKSKPLIKQGYDYVVASYNRAFNPVPVK